MEVGDCRRWGLRPGRVAATGLAEASYKLMDTPVTRVIVICNEQGLHARPATLFVKLAQKFKSRIFLVRDNQRVEAQNIFDVLTLAAGLGTELVLEAYGDDAEEAIKALAELVENGFPLEDADDKKTQTEGSSEQRS
jgi:phosphocarrier protein HPr